jgi:hypothetical protein
MSVTYQRAILIALMRAVAYDPNIAVKSLELPGEGGRGGAGEMFAVTREAAERTSYSNEELQEVEELQTIVSLNLAHEHVFEVCRVRNLRWLPCVRLPFNSSLSPWATVLTQEFDLEDADRFDTASLASVLNELGVPHNEHSLIEMKYLLDPFQYRLIETRSFALYLENLVAKSAQLLHDLTHTRKVCLQGAVLQDFVCPAKGVVKVTVVEAFAADGADSKIARLSGMSMRTVKRVIASAHNSTNSLQMLTCALDGAVFYMEEAKTLFSDLYSILDDPVAAVAMLLPHMATTYDANLLIKCCLRYDMKKVRRLRQKLGPIYNTLTGNLGGFYCLDFTDPLSRQCWKTLLCRSLEVRKRRRFDNFGELSQHGDGIYCFRNIHVVKPFTAPVPGGGAAGSAAAATSGKQWDAPVGQDAEREALLAPLMEVSTIPRIGKIEFDFVSSAVPHVPRAGNHFHTLSDDSFIRVISSICAHQRYLLRH